MKANRSPLAIFIAGSCVFPGVSAGACGRHLFVWRPVQGPIPLSPGPSSLALASIKILKSASTEIPFVTSQERTRGLFKLLDGVIVYPEEITNPWASLRR